jgi:hypothetical protein
MSVMRRLASCVGSTAKPALQLLVGSHVAERATVGQRASECYVEVGHRHGAIAVSLPEVGSLGDHRNATGEAT